jgi:hypothetical protein
MSDQPLHLQGAIDIPAETAIDLFSFAANDLRESPDDHVSLYGHKRHP